MVNFSSSLELFIRKMLLEKMVSNPDRILGIYPEILTIST